MACVLTSPDAVVRAVPIGVWCASTSTCARWCSLRSGGRRQTWCGLTRGANSCTASSTWSAEASPTTAALRRSAQSTASWRHSSPSSPTGVLRLSSACVRAPRQPVQCRPWGARSWQGCRAAQVHHVPVNAGDDTGICGPRCACSPSDGLGSSHSATHACYAPKPRCAFEIHVHFDNPPRLKIHACPAPAMRPPSWRGSLLNSWERLPAEHRPRSRAGV